MTVDTDPNQASPSPESKPATRRRWRTPLLVAGGLAVGLSAVVATTAFSEGWRGGPGGWHHGGPMWGAMTEASAEDRLERMVKHIAVEIDATNEQEEKLVAIAREAAGAITPLRDSMRQAREEVRKLLTAPTIDRSAIEALRAKQIALADSTSKRIVDAITDASEVLTPEQRTELAERMPPVGGPHGGGWHGRWDRQ